MQRHQTIALLVGATIVAVTTATLRADSISLSPTKDNSIYSNGNSNGLGDLFCGQTGNIPKGGAIKLRSLMAFDVAGNIPAGSTITSAKLSLTLLIAPPDLIADPESFGLHRLLSDWGEGASLSFQGIGAPPEPGDATWTHTFFPSEFWDNLGGDFAVTGSAVQIVDVFPLPDIYMWGPTAAMMADVQGWLNDPTTAFGWLLQGNEDEIFTARKFASRESGDLCSGPLLTVQFTPPTPSCVGDLNGEGTVNPQDLALLLGAWGCNPGHSADINGDAMVNPQDLALLLGNWGPC